MSERLTQKRERELSTEVSPLDDEERAEVVATLRQIAGTGHGGRALRIAARQLELLAARAGDREEREG